MAYEIEWTRFYGRPKLHKPDIPLRPIVSLLGTPTYNISRELSRKLKHLIQSCGHSIKSPTESLEKIKNINIENDELMISFDVKALYTSIEPQLAKETISLLINEDKNLSERTKLKCYYYYSVSNWLTSVGICAAMRLYQHCLIISFFWGVGT
ncbi:unnamed protein product [Heterobilharzia americana]|nr:unnamed protein product [Heterobilharzia americana]